MGIKADFTGRVLNRLALRHPSAPVTDLTTLLQLDLHQERIGRVSDTSPVSNTLYDGTDIQDQVDAFFDESTSSTTWPTTP